MIGILTGLFIIGISFWAKTRALIILLAMVTLLGYLLGLTPLKHETQLIVSPWITYGGIGIYLLVLNKDEDTVNIKWNIDSITIPEKQEEINGNWNFALALEATERNTQLSDHSAEQDGVKVNIGKISVTPMSFIVYYDQAVSEKVRNKWHGVDVDIKIKDDLGDSYSGEGNGGSGDSEGYKMSWSKTFEKLDQNATKLIITPHITLREYTSDNFSSVEITKDGPKEIPIPKKSGKGKEEFVLEDIIIELKK